MKKSALCLFLALISLSVASKAQIDTNACKRPAKNGYLVQNINSQSTVSLVTLADARLLFEQLKPRGTSSDQLTLEKHCEARAHMVSYELSRSQRLNSIKVLVEAVNPEPADCGATGAACFGDTFDGSRVLLQYYSPKAQKTFTWSYHTAAALCVRTAAGTDELYVFDHALFDEPIPYKAWEGTVTQGMNPADYKAYSTNMYNIGRMQPGAQNVKTSFQLHDLHYVYDLLSLN